MSGANGEVKRIRLKSRAKKELASEVTSSNYRILQGSVFDRLPEITPGSIDCACTSPPYWMLRSYLPKGHALKHLELGQEKTPLEYVANVVRWCGLVRNALTDHGTLWLNVGDTYSATGKSGGNSSGKNSYAIEGAKGLRTWNPATSGIAAGNLCLIPQRLAIALQDDGWFVRSVVIWHKPAPMPSSVKGWMWVRCRVKVNGRKPVEQKYTSDPTQSGSPQNANAWIGQGEKAEWSDCPGCKKCLPNGKYVLRKGSWRPTSSYEPIIMLAKTARYFADGEAVKTPPAESTVSRDQYTRVIDDPDEQFAVAHDHETFCDGANLRDVWTIPHEALREAHYAAYPTELVRRCLAAGTSAEGYCTQCIAPFVRVVSHTNAVIEKTDRAVADCNRVTCSGTQVEPATSRTIGWRPSCRCPDAKPRPGRVLDPFCGSGRTGIVARRLGLDFTGIELNPEFVNMGSRLIKEDAPLFNEGEAA